MQLYVLDHDPGLAVRFLCDVHLIKMCLETAQIISGVCRNANLKPLSALPKPYNPAHPVIRAIDTPAKLNWVLLYNWNLQCEYHCRFKKAHAFFDLSVRCFVLLWQPEYEADCCGLARCFKDFYSAEADIAEAFREYYRFKKQLIRRWHYTRRPEPEWLF